MIQIEINFAKPILNFSYKYNTINKNFVYLKNELSLKESCIAK